MQSNLPKFALSDRPLRVDDVLAAVQHPGAGAVDLFLGIVRAQSAGQAVEALEYEAYAELAVSELARAVATIEAEFVSVRAAVHHRIGRLTVGELAVVCAASAPHRDEAFRACRALIEVVKQRVPIWKREHQSGAVRWVNWPAERA